VRRGKKQKWQCPECEGIFTCIGLDPNTADAFRADDIECEICEYHPAAECPMCKAAIDLQTEGFVKVK